MFEVQAAEERRQAPYWLLCGRVRHSHLKGGFHVCSIACQRCHQITRDLEVLLLHCLQLSFPGTMGQQDTNTRGRDSSKEKKQDRQ
jgi:hypothetical protein